MGRPPDPVKKRSDFADQMAASSRDTGAGGPKKSLVSVIERLQTARSKRYRAR